jgi:large subunit ribosomal protein L10
MHSKNIVKPMMVTELQRAYADSTLLVAATYHGIPAARMTTLRHKLAAAEGTVHVVKNRLARRALPGGVSQDFLTLLVGPTALAATRGDAVALAKAMLQFKKDNDALVIRGGLLNMARVLTADDVTTLASLPAREVLLARLMGAVQGPVRGLASLLAALSGNLVRVLDRIADAKAAGGAAPTDTEQAN